MPALIVEEELGHVAGHDRKIDPQCAQAKRVPFDPFHPFTASTAPGHVEHRFRRLDADQSVAAFGQLAGQQPGATPDVDDRRCRELRRETHIERFVFGDGIHRIIDRDQSGIVELVEIRNVVRLLILVVDKFEVYQARLVFLSLFTRACGRPISGRSADEVGFFTLLGSRL